MKSGTVLDVEGVTGMLKIKTSLLLVLVLVISGCGIYTLNPHGKSEYKTIAIETFDNKTPQYGVTDRMTEVVIDAFIADGTLKVVSSSNADVILSGTLTRYERVVSIFDKSDRVQQYKVLMDFDVTLKNGKDQSEIWKEVMNQEGTFDANTETEEDGQNRAGQRLVQAILNKTTKSW